MPKYFAKIGKKYGFCNERLKYDAEIFGKRRLRERFVRLCILIEEFIDSYELSNHILTIKEKIFSIRQAALKAPSLLIQ